MEAAKVRLHHGKWPHEIGVVSKSVDAGDGTAYLFTSVAASRLSAQLPDSLPAAGRQASFPAVPSGQARSYVKSLQPFHIDFTRNDMAAFKAAAKLRSDEAENSSTLTSAQSEIDIMARLRDGDEAALADLIDRYWKP